jgi:tetratricopeptide (TPR) repeat protein
VVLVRDAPVHARLLARLPPAEAAAPPPAVSAEAAVAEALAAVAAGDPDRALRRYQDVLGIEPDHPLALYSLAVLREQRGEHPEARALFERVAERAPQSELARQARERLTRLR